MIHNLPIWAPIFLPVGNTFIINVQLVIISPPGFMILVFFDRDLPERPIFQGGLIITNCTLRVSYNSLALYVNPGLGYFCLAFGLLLTLASLNEFVLVWPCELSLDSGQKTNTQT